MATVREVCTRALKRLVIVAAGETPTADEAADALAALNDMMLSWIEDGVDVLMQAPFGLNDTLAFWVPPEALDGATASTTTMDYIAYQGTFNAATNTPALASSTASIRGFVYRVTVAGSVSIDGASMDLAVDDFIVNNGSAWLVGKSVDRYIQGIIAMLAIRLAPDYGKEPAPLVLRDAKGGWDNLFMAFFKHPIASFDRALIRTPARRNNLTTTPPSSEDLLT